MPILFVLFVVVPVAEIALFITVGQAIGIGPTLAIVLATAALGAWLVRSQGTAVARRAVASVRAAQFPGAEIADGAMILFGGALLLTPGFFTDAVGLALMVPGVRNQLRRFGAKQVKSRANIIDL